MPRKPTLSPTKLSTYLACPLRYRFTFVHPQRHLLRAKAYYSFGLSLHRVLEKFMADPNRGVDVKEQVEALYDESWIDAGYGSSEEMAEAYAEGKQIVEAATQALAAAPVTATTIHVEKTLRKDYGEFALVGRVDRIDRHDDGRLEVVDYKSGRSFLEAKGDLALGTYLILLRNAYPGPGLAVSPPLLGERGQGGEGNAQAPSLFEEAIHGGFTATLFSLRSQESSSWTPSEQELNELEFEIGELSRQILNHDWYEMVPIRKPLCETCDFLPLYQRHHEF